MWTEENIKEAAKEWNNEKASNIDAFIAGCKYIIKNAQKD